uniref:5-cytosine rRNA methyltransferase NSUN4 n=1 Tax=Phallusia mammillata TaxID=59560 RepID=A0A6F9DNH4_9ASCI|nr:5-methylcytosine rRNA methyltransferase NSUN4-like [Phallusia mammillata]
MLISIKPAQHIFAVNKSSLYTTVRFKSKKRLFKYKYRNLRSKSAPHEIARDYFDENYPAYFESDWFSIRCAMLSRKKYCCVLNNFISVKDYEKNLIDSGAYDFVGKMNQNARLECALLEAERDMTIKQIQQLQKVEPAADSEETRVTVNSALELIDKHQSILDQIDIYKGLSKNCSNLRAYVYPRADITEFKTSTVIENKQWIHQSYLLDAASVLPVLALGPEEGDDILDMCAAPGGKFITMLQHVQNQARLVANDPSKSRGQHLHGVLHQYLPVDYDIQDTIKTVAFDGQYWAAIETDCYSKVLVDAPCTNDRLSMYETEKNTDNIFCHLRKNERAKLPELQAALLKNAVQACKVGGTVVYSTCSASRWQNEFVVQFVIQDLLDNHNIICELEDLKPMTNLLKDEFNFYPNATVGALVQPHLEANFGPMFICKLSRTT